MSVADYFKERGVLARLWPEFSFNPGQLRMAELVEQTLADAEYLIVEAGTGTGKTFAYLIPAVESRRRVVVTTATKALQEQLIEKDIPFLKETAGLHFEAVVMKGRGNYLCRRRLQRFLKAPTFAVREEVGLLDRIVRWSERTETGDRAELAGLPERLQVWEEINSNPDHCVGQHCPHVRDCFLTKMRARAAGADILVVNHHLFFADLAVRERPHAEVIPRYEAVVFDEAHQIESIATEFFGLQVSNYRFEALVRDAKTVFTALKGLNADTRRRLNQVMEAAGDLLAEVAGRGRTDGRFRIREEDLGQDAGKQLDALTGALTALAERATNLAQRSGGEDAENIARRTVEIREQVELILALDDPGSVYWCEIRRGGVFLLRSPVDVSQDLARRLYDRVDTLVFTSATLSTGGDFSYFKSRTGIARECLEALIPSHFDFRRQALLYLPRRMPDPNDPAFPKAVARQTRRILAASRGRAFVLFTSYRMMEEVHRMLEGRLDHPCLLQGSRPKSVLLDEFRREVDSVLFATASFWQGVDVRGEALSCVIIDRIPFEVPSDPIVEARIEQIRVAGGNPFKEFQLPEAIISLKQGIGRLIRDRQDRGSVTVCDPRLVDKFYGRIILASLPDFPVTRDPADLDAFFSRPEEG